MHGNAEGSAQRPNLRSPITPLQSTAFRKVLGRAVNVALGHTDTAGLHQLFPYKLRRTSFLGATLPSISGGDSVHPWFQQWRNDYALYPHPHAPHVHAIQQQAEHSNRELLSRWA